MENGTTVIQKKAGVKMVFRFDEDKLVRTHADHTGENQFSVFYEAIDIENTSGITAKNTRVYRQVLVVLLVCFGACTMLSSALKIDSYIVGFLTILFSAAIAGILIAIYFKPLSIKYTVLQIPGKTGVNTIRIIHDRNRDAILEEIKARWMGRLRKLHGAVNFNNDLNKEVQKFRWLKDHGVISDPEYREAIAKLEKVSQGLASDDKSLIH